MSLTVPKDGGTVAEPVGVGPAERAAVVLALLEEKGLTALSGRLSAGNRARFSRALEGLRDIGPEQQQAIVAAFAKQLATRRAGVAGGTEAADRIGSRLYGEAPAEPEEPPQADIPKTFWERVEALGAGPLAEYLDGCPVPAVATCLGQLPEAFAADVLAEMPEGPSVASVVKLARTAKANPVALRAVEAMIDAAFFGEKATATPVDTARADRIAGLLNRMPTNRREAVLGELPGELDEAMLAAVKERVLGFDDLAGRLPRNVVPVIFREAPEDTLLAALSYAGARGSKTAEYLFANISQRLAEQLKERLPRDVGEEAGEKAQAGIVGFVLGLVEDGQAELLDAGADA